MTVIIHHKAGTPFDMTGQWLNDFGSPIDLTEEEITITSQVRHPATDELIAELTVTRPDSTHYRVYATDTADWPVDRLIWDIRYHVPGEPDTNTETAYIDVSRAVTRS